MVNSINMPVSRERMENYQNKHMRQIEHAAKQVEARESKTKNNNMRRVWLQRQNNSNYRNEYDRMLGHLGHYKVPYKIISQLEARDEKLRKLFSSGNV
jgi:ribosomal protein L20